MRKSYTLIPNKIKGITDDKIISLIIKNLECSEEEFFNIFDREVIDKKLNERYRESPIRVKAVGEVSHFYGHEYWTIPHIKFEKAIGNKLKTVTIPAREDNFVPYSINGSVDLSFENGDESDNIITEIYIPIAQKAAYEAAKDDEIVGTLCVSEIEVECYYKREIDKVNYV